MTDQPDVVVVGGGQAGLSVSWELARAGVEHVVLERGRVGESWRGRWDSFCLVTPNWTLRLPGHAYDGDDPDGFDGRDAVVSYLDRYAADAPVHTGVEATALRRRPEGGFLLETTAGPLAPRQVVLATGAYQRPHVPPAWETLPEDLPRLGLHEYRSPGALPDGPVLVVGSGQSGCQVAEELHEAGRSVVLSCGRAPWAPRRIGDRDLVWWLVESGFLDAPCSSLPAPEARLAGNVLVTGRDRGHDLHLRTLHDAGVTLTGRLLGAAGRRASFAADLGASVAWGDERHGQLIDLFRRLAEERGMPPLDVPPPAPFGPEGPEEVDLTGFGAAILASGFRPGYDAWVDCPGAFDALGFPVHAEGACTAVAGLHFTGVHFLRKRKSSLFIGVGEDAAIVAGQIAAVAG
jgi:putative flavoprotein involved in K+ transport